MAWYPADWRPGKKGAAPIYTPHGPAVELVGGPLDGREADVTDPGESLWVAEIRSERGRLFVVRSSATRPGRLPGRAALLGRYTHDGGSALQWHRDDEGRDPEPQSRAPDA